MIRGSRLLQPSVAQPARTFAPAGEARALVADDVAREAGQDRRQDVCHGRYAIFQLAEVAVPRVLFAEILRRIDRLRGSPVPVT